MNDLVKRPGFWGSVSAAAGAGFLAGLDVKVTVDKTVNVTISESPVTICGGGVEVERPAKIDPHQTETQEPTK